jgi:hypothetical protein
MGCAHRLGLRDRDVFQDPVCSRVWTSSISTILTPGKSAGLGGLQFLPRSLWSGASSALRALCRPKANSGA